MEVYRSLLMAYFLSLRGRIPKDGLFTNPPYSAGQDNITGLGNRQGLGGNRGTARGPATPVPNLSPSRSTRTEKPGGIENAWKKKRLQYRTFGSQASLCRTIEAFLGTCPTNGEPYPCHNAESVIAVWTDGLTERLTMPCGQNTDHNGC